MVKENTKNVYLKVKDHSVSGEEFSLIENSEYGFLETHPQPDLKLLPQYYKSDDYISHTDAKRNVFEKAYHLVRSYALNKKLQLINSLQTDSKIILDVGCGTGDFLQTAKKNGWSVFGIEPNLEARGVANRKTNNAVFDVNQLSKFDSHSFDVITLWHVLEHLPNLEVQIKCFKKVLKPNGTLIIAVPNYKSYDAVYYKSFWAAYDVPRHLWHFNAKSIASLFSKIEMHVKNIIPMPFDAFYVSLLSEKYKTGKMNYLKGFVIGLRSNIKAISSKEASSLIYVLKNK
ncbi:class I SAM-dependent methyltransferase [Aestuariibaculum sediminum]|uniref:Class I SAM-dependent methyltransferase n=1 Tax=Aestuariibaculum sediminum TaxID=2770637 RepID=A0A8J6U714_9FLAO|nr:class I SAM-dependent methyltransferase [Aestuariibaculum sediminum]MBD0831240.1 class I SAM-dependent methyltransferase [Aestuariibaculum sediminum]